MGCPHHTELAIEARCELQRLADHTITVTQARRPVAALVVLIDAHDPTHVALGAGDVSPLLALHVLRQLAERIEASL